MFLLEFIFRWEVVAVGIGILVTIGFAVLPMDDFKMSKKCFLFAAIWAGGGIVMWGINTTQSTGVRWLIVGASCAIIGILAVESLRYVNRKQVIKAQAPTVTNALPELEQPTFREKIDMVFFQLGGQGITVGYKLEQLTNNKATPFNLSGHHPFTVYVENNRIYADVKLYTGQGEFPIEVVHNEFTVRRPGWDKNSNKDALEIVNENHKPVFQMIYQDETHLVIKGIFPYPGGLMLAGEKGVDIVSIAKLQTNPNLIKEFALQRIFKYPSSKYPGQLD